MAWGFFGNKEVEQTRENAYNEQLSKSSKIDSDSVSNEYKRKKMEADIYAKQRLKAQRQRALNEAKSRFAPKKNIPIGQGLRAQVQKIGSQVNSSQIRNENRNTAAVTNNININQEKAKDQEEINNFFEHKSEQEVYGDEGLTFFDSNKSRSVRRTGELFGI